MKKFLAIIALCLLTLPSAGQAIAASKIDAAKGAPLMAQAPKSDDVKPGGSSVQKP